MLDVWTSLGLGADVREGEMSYTRRPRTVCLSVAETRVSCADESAMGTAIP